MLYLSNIFEVLSIWDIEAFHSIRVTPFLEMLFKSSSSPITSATTNLTPKFLTQPV